METKLRSIKQCHFECTILTYESFFFSFFFQTLINVVGY